MKFKNTFIVVTLGIVVLGCKPESFLENTDINLDDLNSQINPNSGSNDPETSETEVQTDDQNLAFKYNRKSGKCKDIDGNKGKNVGYMGECGDLNGSHYLKEKPKGKNLSGISLSNSVLINQNFKKTNLEGSDLSHSEFKGSNFKKANFLNARLRGADFRGAKYKLKKVIGLTTDYNKQTQFNEGTMQDNPLEFAKIHKGAMKAIKKKRKSSKKETSQVRNEIKELKANLKAAKKTMSKQQYQAYKKSILIAIRAKKSLLKKINEDKSIHRKLSKKHKKKHKELRGIASSQEK